MIIRRFSIYTSSLLLSLSTFSFAQEVAEKPAKKALTQAEIFKQVKKVSSQDLSGLKHPQKPMLWKVEGKDLKKASYLFGSIHVSDTNITTLHPDAEAAYQQADTLATEINLDLENQLKVTDMMARTDKKNLKQSIGDELYAELNTQLTEINPALTAEAFNTMKTWSAMLIHGMIEEQLKSGNRKPLDLQLWDKAAEDGKKQWPLETLKEQIGGFDKLTDDEQKTLLKDALFATKLLKKENINAITMLKNLYLKGDSDQITSLLNKLGTLEGTNREVGEKFEKLLIFDRNERMAVNIHKHFTQSPDKSHFIVAGTMHFLGEHNIIDMLRKQGYTVTRK